jgi:hypothetical protein
VAVVVLVAPTVVAELEVLLQAVEAEPQAVVLLLTTVAMAALICLILEQVLVEQV